MKNLGIIIARKNSKRLKNKNILQISKIKLIEFTIIAAIKSKKFHQIVVSSDEEKILNLKKKYKSVNFLNRPKFLTKEKVKAIEVVQNIINSKNYENFDNVALMLPSCPFRNSKDIQNAFNIFKKTDTVISACKYSFPPELALVEKKDKYAGYFLKKSPYLDGNTSSQFYEKCLRPNGGIYISNIKKLKKIKSFFKGKIKLYKMPIQRSIDIDNRIDFELAKLIYNKKLFS